MNLKFSCQLEVASLNEVVEKAWVVVWLRNFYVFAFDQDQVGDGGLQTKCMALSLLFSAAR